MALCFDDAWASLWTVAAPLLKQYGLTAIAYADSGPDSRWPACRPTLAETATAAVGTPFVTWPELRALHTSGIVDVQCHTETHSMVFCSDAISGFVTPAYTAVPMLNRPQLSPLPELRFLEPDQLGAPLYENRSRMSAARRVIVPMDTHARCIDLVASEGGAAFFSKAHWETDLRELAKLDDDAFLESEAESHRAIEVELDRSRSTLNDRLRTNTVKHVCLPWGVEHVHRRDDCPARVRLGDRQSTTWSSRRAPRRRPVLAEAPAEPVHLPSARPWTAAMGVMPFPSDISIVIVAHNNRDQLPSTLASLDDAGCPHAAICVIDVASTDGTVDWLRSTYPDVSAKTLTTNDGPNPGRNLGIRESSQPVT